MVRITRRLAAGLLCLLVCGCGGPRVLVDEPGTHRLVTDLKGPGGNRRYNYHVPTGGRAAAQAQPLLIVIHGAFSDAREIEWETGFSDLSDREGFIVAYPEGIGLFGLFQHWNAGHCCGKAMDDNIDDVGFIRTVSEQLTAHFALRPGRAYVVGISNGGMMAYRVAAEHPDHFAAVAGVNTTVGSRRSPTAMARRIAPPRQPVPVLIMHGRDDRTIPYEGGPRQGDEQGQVYDSVAESIDFWIEHNRCDREATKTTLRQGAVDRTEWRGAAGSAPVLLYRLNGWGHYWPGPVRLAEFDVQGPLREFDAATVVWEFFQQIDARQPR